MNERLNAKETDQVRHQFVKLLAETYCYKDPNLEKHIDPNIIMKPIIAKLAEQYKKSVFAKIQA